MNDEINNEMLESEEELFDDLFEEDSEDTIEEPAAEEEDVPTTSEDDTGSDTESAKTYAYKLNHTETQLDAAAVENIAAALGIEPEAFVANLQKGADYDRRTQQYEAQRPLVQAIEAFAAQRGVSTEEAARQMIELSEKLEAAKKAADIKQRAEEAKLKFPGLNETAAQKMAELQTENQLLNDTKRQQEEEARRQEELRKPLNDFFVAHPEFLQNELPERFKELYNSGLTPNEAWLTMQAEAANAELQQLRQQYAVAEQQKKAAAKSPGSMQAEVGKKEEDAFLSAFNM